MTVLERGHYYVIAATATSPGPQWLVKGTHDMLAPGAASPGAVGYPAPSTEFSGGSSSQGTSPQPAPWPKSPQGRRATTWDWPCSA